MATTLTRTISEKRIGTTSPFNAPLKQSASDLDEPRILHSFKKSPRLSITTSRDSPQNTSLDPATDSLQTFDLNDIPNKHHADLARFYEDFRCFLMGDDEDGVFSTSSSPNNSPKSNRDTAGMSPLSPRRSISSSVTNTILKKKKKQLVDFTEVCIRKRNISTEFVIDLAVKFHQQIIPKDNRHLLKSFKDSFTGREAVTLMCQLINAEQVTNVQETLPGISSIEEARLLAQSLCHLMLHFRFIFHMTHKKHFKDSGYSFYGLCKNLKKAQTDFISDFTKPASPKIEQIASTSTAPLAKRKSFSFSLSLNLKKLQEVKENTVDSDDEDCCIDTTNVQPFVLSKNMPSNHHRSSVSSSTETTPKTPTGTISKKNNKRNTLMIPKLNFNHILHLNNHHHHDTSDDNAPKSEVIEISKPFDLEFSILQRKELSNSVTTQHDSSDEENQNNDSCKGTNTTKRPSPQKSSSADMTTCQVALNGNTRSRRSSLSQLLSDNYMREQFKLYSRDELSSENVIFYEEVLKFLNSLFLSEEEQRKVAINLYELFVPTTSLYQLNLPSKLILKFNKEYETNFANTANVVLLFKEALIETEHSMHDTYKRFQFTKEYQQYKLRKLLHDKDERSDGFNTSRY
ncbi:hypothetical protein C9374_007967 [Naegleria lovaniensis]|uniref:RGS domain-containing protein n=1 Tax=Naegleria lovaniensis TaxID=51637 RepID=A0AA88GG81_NAELO|nr:uncharacterized protein C9374_007967 [Naegleria lovaniensis]KAG2378819.1 hypothetical protein C9374_007967 [Naegleria lovaniensis]